MISILLIAALIQIAHGHATCQEVDGYLSYDWGFQGVAAFPSTDVHCNIYEATPVAGAPTWGAGQADPTSPVTVHGDAPGPSIKESYKVECVSDPSPTEPHKIKVTTFGPAAPGRATCTPGPAPTQTVTNYEPDTYWDMYCSPKSGGSYTRIPKSGHAAIRFANTYPRSSEPTDDPDACLHKNDEFAKEYIVTRVCINNGDGNDYAYVTRCDSGTHTLYSNQYDLQTGPGCVDPSPDPAVSPNLDTEDFYALAPNNGCNPGDNFFQNEHRAPYAPDPAGLPIPLPSRAWDGINVIGCCDGFTDCMQVDDQTPNPAAIPCPRPNFLLITLISLAVLLFTV